jgi:hypothetical protein
MARPMRLRHAGSLAVLVFAAITLRTSGAHAQEPLGIDPIAPSPAAAGGTEQAVVARYWALGRPRFFLATMLEAGYAYARPRFAFGYGLPYWRWIGLEAYPLVSLGGLGQYAGIGGAIPGLSFRAGGRYYFPFSRSFLEPKESFNRLDIDSLEGPTADYLALEAEVTATVPVPAGSLFAVLTGYYTLLVPEGFFQYEESLRTVMEPPYIWRARLGYLFAFMRDSALRVGPAADLIGLPGRDEFVVRAGVLASVAISAHLEAQASFIPVIVSPDTLGLAGGDFGQLGIRFRWATGSTPDPEALRKAQGKRLEELKQEQRSNDER